MTTTALTPQVTAGRTQTAAGPPAEARELPKRGRVLLVDDDRAQLTVLSHILESSGFEVTRAASVASARGKLAQSAFDIVLLDVIMPDENGLLLLDELSPLSPNTIAIVLTGLQGTNVVVDALERGAYDYLRKPFTGESLVVALERSLHHRQLQMDAHLAAQRLQEALKQQTDELRRLREMSADGGRALLRAAWAVAEGWGIESQGHLVRVRAISCQIATALPHALRARARVDDAYLESLGECAPVHDIGQIAIANDILLRAGPLTPDEYGTVQEHPVLGRRMLERMGRHMESGASAMLDMGLDVCAAHHERFDGAGYPAGLGGDDIPLAARIVAVADFYDTATSPRPYRARPFPQSDVVQAVKGERNRAFDPAVVDAFLSAEARIAAVKQQSRDRSQPSA